MLTGQPALFTSESRNNTLANEYAELLLKNAPKFSNKLMVVFLKNIKNEDWYSWWEAI